MAATFANPTEYIQHNLTFFARPFGEMDLIALAKAYQDVARHHFVKPTKMDA